jgi:uncharacterized protein YkwD
MLSVLAKWSIALVLAMEVSAGSAPKPPVELKTANLQPVEQSILERTNAERVRYGLAPLAIDPNLENTARAQAAWMTNNRIMQHGNWGVAENIAMGQQSAEEALGSWMASSGHRANILNPGYRRIGVAAYTAPDGSCYWCQQFTP